MRVILEDDQFLCLELIFRHRVLRTGVHTVADVHCLGCNDRIGWYYLKASSQPQKYKEGEHPRPPHEP